MTKQPFNAVGDGKTLNTSALQKAFDACDGEHIVFFPEGTYLTGALDVHSDTEIYLSKGALLQGTKDPSDYLPKIHSRFELKQKRKLSQISLPTICLIFAPKIKTATIQP